MTRSLKIPVVIVVTGAAKSGKTTSLSTLLRTYFKFMNNRKDFRVVVPGGPKRAATAVGISSAGDEAKQVLAGLKFLEESDCDVYICAARVGSRGTSLMLATVQAFASRIGATLVPIHITRSSTPGNVASIVWSKIP